MFVLQSVQIYPTAILICHISAAVILLVFLALMLQFSLRRNEAESANVLYNFVFVFFKVSCVNNA